MNIFLKNYIISKCDENFEEKPDLRILLMESNTSPQREEMPKYEQIMTSSMHLLIKLIITKRGIQQKNPPKKVAFFKWTQLLHENSRQAAKRNLKPGRKKSKLDPL